MPAGQRGQESYDTTTLIIRWQALAQLAGQARIGGDDAPLLLRLLRGALAATGFAQALLYEMHPDGTIFVLTAHSGLRVEDLDRLSSQAIARQRIPTLLSPDFALTPGRSYLIPPRDLTLVADCTPIRLGRVEGPSWGPHDTCIAPLIAGNSGQIAALLFLLDPQAPFDLQESARAEHIAQVEAFADLLAATRDNVQALAEANTTRTVLERGMFDLLRQLNLARQGDFTVQFPVSASSLGPIVDLFNQIVSEVNRSFTRLRATARSVNEQAVLVRDQTLSMRADTTEQTEQIATVSTTIDAIARSVDALVLASGDATRVAVNSREIAAEGRLAIEDAVRGMEAAREAAQRSSLQVKRLGEHVQEIATIIGQIGDISQKTQLLAINAAIEATRAGEHGRGFAAIAQEIRTLGLNSSDALQLISERIVALQQSAQTVVTAVEDGAVNVVNQSERVIDAGAMLSALDDFAEEIAALSQRISASTTEESSRITLLVETMRSILALTGATRDEIAQIDRAMEQLLDLTRPLYQEIGQINADRSASRIPIADLAEPPLQPDGSLGA